MRQSGWSGSAPDRDVGADTRVRPARLSPIPAAREGDPASRPRAGNSSARGRWALVPPGHYPATLPVARPVQLKAPTQGGQARMEEQQPQSPEERQPPQPPDPQPPREHPDDSPGAPHRDEPEAHPPGEMTPS